MVISKEMLLERRKQYEQEQQQHALDFSAVSGAIQDIDYWLGKLQETELAESSGTAPEAGGS